MCFQKETLLRIRWFFGLMVDLVVPVLMGLFMNMVCLTFLHCFIRIMHLSSLIFHFLVQKNRTNRKRKVAWNLDLIIHLFQKHNPFNIFVRIKDTCPCVLWENLGHIYGVDSLWQNPCFSARTLVDFNSQTSKWSQIVTYELGIHKFSDIGFAGPFNFEKTGSMPKLHLNPYTWTKVYTSSILNNVTNYIKLINFGSFFLKVSNVIYLDSPAGVGLSYSGNQSDYITRDTTTALDSHKFLLEVFSK